MERMLITGGCGFVGSNLIARLANNGQYVLRVFDNESLGKYEWIEEFGTEFIKGDLVNKDEVRKALADVDVVVHLAADTRVMDSIANPDFNFQSNVVGTYNLLSSMRELGIKRIVNASTGGAIIGEVPPPVHEAMLPQPVSPYGAAKLACEGYCGAFAGSYGFKATSLRFSNVYGPRSFHKGSVVAQFFKNILNNRPLVVYGDGSQTRDYVFAEDLAEGIEKAIAAGVADVFQLGTGVPTSLNELIDGMRLAVGPEYPVQVRYEPYRDGEIRHTYCDISKARKAFGYEIKTTVNDGLAKTWAWFLANRGYFQTT